MKVKELSGGSLRLRWRILLLLVPFMSAGLIHWLTKPLPPPVVSLNLVGFKVTPTNAYAQMAMTNNGPTKVYFRSDTWRAEFQTSRGVMTNYPYFWMGEPFPRSQGEGGSFTLDMPNGVTSWRVTATFEYQHRHNLRLEIIEWLDRHLEPGKLQTVLERVLGPVLGERPERFELYRFVSTPWLTNLPPTTASP